MKLSDAAQLLELSGMISPDDVRAAYLAAAKKFHPDINPAGEEMMKLIVAAYETLKDYIGEVDQVTTAGGRSYPDALNDALNAIIATPLDIEICGAWIWVSGDTFGYKTVLGTAGFKWASKKKQWYFRPEDWKSRSRGKMSMDAIRSKYGSERPAKTRKALDDEAAA